ncbi:MAG: Rpn family recombination-promoting nuclease/putative transposase [Haliangiales bacterium]
MPAGAEPELAGAEPNESEEVEEADQEEEIPPGVTTPRMAHDALFKHLFGEPQNAAAALRFVLPPEVNDLFNWDTLTLEHGSMVSRDLEQRHGDLLYSAEQRQEEQPVLLSILLEHQSTEIVDMSWRVTEKAVYHAAEWRKRHDQRKRVPPMLSFVFYHGTKPWTAPVDVIDLMGISEATKAILQPYLLSYRFILDDLHTADDSEIDKRAVKPALRLGLVAMKYARSELLIDRLVAHHADIQVLLASEPGRDQWLVLLHYVRTMNPHVGPDELIDRLKPVVGPEIEETMLTEGQRLEKRIYDEGHKQGHKQGYHEGQAHGRDLLLRQLGCRFGPLPALAVYRVSNASADELIEWGERILDAESLDDVFAGS